MTNTDVATKSEAAIDKALRDMRTKPDQNFAPKDRHSLTELLDDLTDLHEEQGRQLASAKKVLALILGGLK